MIRLFTGTPGAGKTLRSIFEALQKKSEGRHVFHLGIDGMNPEFIPAAPFDDLQHWRSLPPGSILIVDEAHKYLPVRSPGKPVEWIQLLTEIRHFGIELWLVTQDPRNIDSFVRRLVGSHTHLTRKVGLQGAMVRVFEGISEDPQDPSAKKTAVSSPWKYPKHLYAVYKSASLHTVKPRVPWKVWFAGLGSLFGIVFIVYAIVKVFSSFGDDAPVQSNPQSSTPSESQSLFQSSSSMPKGSSHDYWESAEKFIEAHTPLVPNVPWSAPIHAGLKPTSVPEILCVASGLPGASDRSCNCYTEQATRIHGVPRSVCESYVLNGSYNPYRPVSSNNPSSATQGAPADASSTSSAIHIN